MDPQTVQLALTAVAAGALAIQTIFMIVLAFIAVKAIRTAKEEMEEYRSSIMPIINKTRDLVQDLSPKIEAVSARVQEASGEMTHIVKSLRTQTEDVKVAADDIIERTRKQASRVDGMVTNLFDHVERAGGFMADAVAKPMRQLSGLIASIKAAVESLRESESGHTRPPRPIPPRYTSDGEHLGPRPTGTTTPFRP